MKFNREHLEELTLQKIKEVNDEAEFQKLFERNEKETIKCLINETKELYDKLEAWEACADRLFVYAMEILSTATNMALYEVAKEDVLVYNRLKNKNE